MLRNAVGVRVSLVMLNLLVLGVAEWSVVPSVITFGGIMLSIIVVLLSVITLSVVMLSVTTLIVAERR